MSVSLDTTPLWLMIVNGALLRLRQGAPVRLATDASGASRVSQGDPSALDNAVACAWSLMRLKSSSPAPGGPRSSERAQAGGSAGPLRTIPEWIATGAFGMVHAAAGVIPHALGKDWVGHVRAFRNRPDRGR
jgi:hypothetical protein